MNRQQPYAMAPVERPEDAPLQAPFHFRTLHIRVRARRHIILAAAVTSLLCGILAAKLVGHKTYEANIVLLYKPAAGAGPESDGNEAPSLLTQLDMLKLPANLEETRRRLGLSVSTEALGKSIDAQVPINSSLMVVKVQWNSADKAAKIANTLTEVFLARQLAVQHQEAAAKIHDLEVRLAKVQDDLHVAEANLKEFTIKNHVVDLDKEAGWYLQQLINAELVYEQAVGEQRADQLQEAKINNIVNELKTKAREEEDQVLSDPGKASLDPARRAEEDAIRGRMANLKLKEVELERDKALYDSGILSRADFEKAKAGYESEKFALYNNSPSAGLLKEMTLKELTVRLNGISDQQKVAQLRTAVERVRAKLDGLPLVQREYLSLQREVAIRAAERERIGQFMSLARRQNESEAFPFSIVSHATPPVLPLNSNRRILFIAISIAGTLFGLAVTVVLEIANRKVFSIGDGKAKLKKEVLAGFAVGEERHATESDSFLTLASRLRQMGLLPGAKLLVVSPTPGEGAAQIALSVVRTLSETGDSCLLIDADFRKTRDVPHARQDAGPPTMKDRAKLQLEEFFKPRLEEGPDTITDLRLSTLLGVDGGKGLSDLLVGGIDQDYTIPFANRVRLLSAGTILKPELLVSSGIAETLAHVCRSEEITVVYTAPAVTFPDATFLAPNMNSALVVIAAGRCTSGEIGRCIDGLEKAGVPVLGTVLTGIIDVYAEPSAAR